MSVKIQNLIKPDCCGTPDVLISAHHTVRYIKCKTWNCFMLRWSLAFFCSACHFIRRRDNCRQSGGSSVSHSKLSTLHHNMHSRAQRRVSSYHECPWSYWWRWKNKVWAVLSTVTTIWWTVCDFYYCSLSPCSFCLHWDQCVCVCAQLLPSVAWEKQLPLL